MAVKQVQIVLCVRDGTVYQPKLILGQFGLLAGKPGKILRVH